MSKTRAFIKLKVGLPQELREAIYVHAASSCAEFGWELSRADVPEVLEIDAEVNVRPEPTTEAVH